MQRVHWAQWIMFVFLGSVLFLSSCQLWYSVFPPVGTWRQDVTYTGIQSGLPTMFRFDFTFNADKTMEADFSAMQNTQYIQIAGERGTYVISNGDILTLNQTEAYSFNDQTSTGAWTASSDTGSAQFSVSGNTMTLTLDLDKNGQYDTSHPIADTYPGGGGQPTDVTFTLTKVSG